MDHALDNSADQSCLQGRAQKLVQMKPLLVISLHVELYRILVATELTALADVSAETLAEDW